MKINLQVYLSIYEILNRPIYLHTLYIWFYDFNIYIVSKINFYELLLSLTSHYLSVAPGTRRTRWSSRNKRSQKDPKKISIAETLIFPCPREGLFGTQMVALPSGIPASSSEPGLQSIADIILYTTWKTFLSIVLSNSFNDWSCPDDLESLLEDEPIKNEQKLDTLHFQLERLYFVPLCGRGSNCEAPKATQKSEADQ